MSEFLRSFDALFSHTSIHSANVTEDRIADYNSVTDLLVICDTSLMKAYQKLLMDSNMLKVIQFTYRKVRLCDGFFVHFSLTFRFSDFSPTLFLSFPISLSL